MKETMKDNKMPLFSRGSFMLRRKTIADLEKILKKGAEKEIFQEEEEARNWNRATGVQKETGGDIATGKDVESRMQLLDEWMNDESGYDEKNWPEIRSAIEKNRFSLRRRFHE